MPKRTMTDDERKAYAVQCRSEFEALMEALDEFISELDDDEEERIRARWPQYNGNNPLLIAMQLPKAREVHSFKGWLALGRVVQRDEHGARILQPRGARGKATANEDKPEESPVPVAEPESSDDTPTSRRYMKYKLISVFSRAQTVELPPKDK